MPNCTTGESEVEQKRINDPDSLSMLLLIMSRHSSSTLAVSASILTTDQLVHAPELSYQAIFDLIS